MENNFLIELSQNESLEINGGGLNDFLPFLISPALGFFHLGVKEGFREAQREDSKP